MLLQSRSLRRGGVCLATLLAFTLACGESAGGSGLSATSSPATAVTTAASTGGSTGSSTGSTGNLATDPGTSGSTTSNDATTTTTTGPTLTATSSVTDATGSTGGPPASLCEPAGNLIDVGSLDGGMNGDAPVGWDVRTPGQPGACAGSGPHVFASGPAPGCAGGAITIDANDAWDCYAVQTVSPYNSIEGGATYRIRAAVRSQGNAVNPAAWFVLGVQWLDANDGFFGDEKNPQPVDPADNDYEWKVLEWELVAPADARRILVWMTAHYPGQVEYDHVAVLKQ